MPDKRLVYMFGIAGHPELSPVMRGLAADGWDIVVPDVPGFNGASGFEVPTDYLGWLTTFWDALDATGALPCPVVGASLGGMIATELAALRPEAVTKWRCLHRSVQPTATIRALTCTRLQPSSA